jgi:hypothetical protein
MLNQQWDIECATYYDAVYSKPNNRITVLCHLGCGNIRHIFQLRLPGDMGAEVLSGSLFRL